MAPRKAKASKQDRNPKRGKAAVPLKKGSGAKAAPSSGTKKAGPAAKHPVGRPLKIYGVKSSAPAKLLSVDSSKGPSSREAGKSGASRDGRLPGRGRKVAASTGKDVSPPAVSRSPSGGTSRAHLRSSPRTPARPEPSPPRQLDVKVTEKKSPKEASTAAVAASQLPAVEASVGRRDKELPVAKMAPTRSTSEVLDFSSSEVEAVKPAPCETGKNYHCCVRDCTTSTGNSRGIWMFALPQEEKLAAAWRKAVPINLRRNRPLSPRVCFQHFNTGDFVRRRLRLVGLAPTAVPCINASKLSSSAGASMRSNRQTPTRCVASGSTAKRSEEAESDGRVPASKASIPSEGGSSTPDLSKELESAEETRPFSEETQQRLAAASSGTVDVASEKPRNDVEVAPPGSSQGDYVDLATAELMRDASVVPPVPEQPSSFGVTPVKYRLDGGEVTPTERLACGSESAAEGPHSPEDVAEERELPRPLLTPPGNLEHDGKEERPSELAVSLSEVRVSVDKADDSLLLPPSGASLQPGLVEAEAPAASPVPPLWENADVCELQEEVVLTQYALQYLVSEEMDPSELALSIPEKPDDDGGRDRLGASTSRDGPGASEAYDVRDAATVLRIDGKECLEDTSQDDASSGEGARTSCAASPAPSGSQKTTEIGSASAAVKDCTRSFPEPKNPGRSWKTLNEVDVEGFLPIPSNSRELPEAIPPEVQRTEADANTDAPGDVDAQGLQPIPSDSRQLPEGVPPEVQRTEADANTDAPGYVDTQGFLPIPSDSRELPEGVPSEVQRTEADANVDAPGYINTQGFLPIPSDSRELPEGVPPEVGRTEADANTDASGDDSSGMPSSIAADPKRSSGAVGAHRSSLPTTNSTSSVPTPARGNYAVVVTPVGDEDGAYMCAVVWEGDGDPDWSDKEEEGGSNGNPPALTFQEVQEDLPWLVGGAWEIQEGPDGIVVTQSAGGQARVVVSRDLTASSFLGNRRVLGPRQITEVNDLIVFFKVLIAR
ncbi:cell surface glycoprotein 1 isoform X1 [Ixodes scapularis]|uniref:cell surface glycoprotein 1 isoform X1 n=1 Tax=Ixodes scapularis TaxID=6945 RepID=UPI001A9E56E3|nr:cell surface glycoprotein 1 isoform X1 [Ixodes scapularis]